MVRRSTVAVSLVVVLVLLSGCSAVLDGGNGNGAGNGNGVDDGGDASTFEYPDGYGPDGVTDSQAAVESHQSGVIDRGSYTGTYTYTFNNSDGTTVVDVENRVDFQNQQGLQRADVTYPNQEGTVTVYRDSDTRYQRTEFNNQTSVSKENQSFDPSNMTVTEPIRPLLVNLSQYDASVEQRNGDDVVVYETSGTEGVDSFGGINESADITSLSATMTVDGDGVVRSATYDVKYTVDGNQRQLTVEYEVSGFGETSVERPAWVDDA